MAELDISDLAFNRGLLAARGDRAPEGRASRKPTTREIIAWARASADRAAPWPDMERVQIPSAAVVARSTGHNNRAFHRTAIAIGGAGFVGAAVAGLMLMM